MFGRKGTTPLSGAEEQTLRAISAYARYAFLVSWKMGGGDKQNRPLAINEQVNSRQHQAPLLLQPLKP
jgi:hypothetical protein